MMFRVTQCPTARSTAYLPINYMRLHLLILLCCLSSHTFAQAVDSVIVTGQIKNLSARLYRDAPTVLVSRNNILKASRELVRPAPLNVDGSFRVAMPLIYPQEEMYFTYGRISTAFLAAPGTLRIDLNADSLFTAAVPFRFGGVNAQVNQQYARYKATEAALPNKPDFQKLSETVASKGPLETYRTVLSEYQTALRKFNSQEPAFPLLSRWVQSINRYNAAAFVYDKAAFEGEQVPKTLADSLRPANDRLLTAARAQAMNRFGDYAMQQNNRPEISRDNNSVAIGTLSSLLLRYGRDLTPDEQTRLESYRESNSIKQADLRFFQRLVSRSNDTIQRLVTYENILKRSRDQFDKASVDYLTAYLLANALPSLTLDFAKLLYSYARPQVTDPQLVQSIDELYRLEVGDSVRIRQAVQRLQKAGNRPAPVEITTGVFVTRDAAENGRDLFDHVVDANRGKVIYVLLTTATEEGGRQAALDAQRLRNAYNSNDLAIIYLPVTDTESNLWSEFATKTNLYGDHLLLTAGQLSDVMSQLRPVDNLAAVVIDRAGKIKKRNAPLPSNIEESRKVLEKYL